MYNGSKSGGSGGERNGGAANAGYEEGDDERSEGSTNSDNSGSGSSGVNKKVKFNESVAVKVRICWSFILCDGERRKKTLREI